MLLLQKRGVWWLPFVTHFSERADLSAMRSNSSNAWSGGSILAAEAIRAAAAGSAAIVIVGFVSGYTAWAQQPGRRVTQIVTPIATPPVKAVWTPMSGAPAGLLTALEGAHHDRFIERAQAGDIDIVFFGTTETEMWSWPDRGRSVWDRTLGRRKAANFGSQGTRFESLLWRMQNGELDGYHAQVVVLQAFGTGDQVIDDRAADVVDGYTRLIAEIRTRQPQAKILLSIAFPRGGLHRSQWRDVADANAAVYRKLADEKTVFSVNIGERFFLPDGSYNKGMWQDGGANAGAQTPAFEAWAEELKPWLDRFVS